MIGREAAKLERKLDDLVVVVAQHGMAELEAMRGNVIWQRNTGPQGQQRQHLLAFLDDADSAARFRRVQKVVHETSIQRQLGQQRVDVSHAGVSIIKQVRLRKRKIKHAKRVRRLAPSGTA